MTASVTVNGEVREFPESDFPATILALLEKLHIDPGMIVAEVNGDLVRRNDFAATAITSGDVVELVRFVGGG